VWIFFPEVGIVVSDFSRCVPVSEWETGWGISGHSGDVGFGSPSLKFPSAGSEKTSRHSVIRTLLYLQQNINYRQILFAYL